MATRKMNKKKVKNQVGTNLDNISYHTAEGLN